MSDHAKAVSFVALESGAIWPAWVREACHQRAVDTIVEAQGELESPADFAERVSKKLKGLCQAGLALRLAIIVTPGPAAEAAEASQLSIGRAAVDAIIEGGGDGELVIALEPPKPVEEAVRHQLLALAGGLCSLVRGAPVTVSVKFNESRRQSGFVPNLWNTQSAAIDRAASGLD